MTGLGSTSFVCQPEFQDDWVRRLRGLVCWSWSWLRAAARCSARVGAGRWAAGVCLLVRGVLPGIAPPGTSERARGPEEPEPVAVQ